MIATLAADPGKTTAGAALVLPPRVLGWWAWTWLAGRGGRYRLRSPRGELEVPDMNSVAQAIARCLPDRYHLVVEGLYAARRKRRRRGKPPPGPSQADVLKLAVAKGKLMGPLEGNAVSVREPPWVEWAPAVLGLSPHMGAKDAEEYAVQAVLGLGWVKGEQLVWECAPPAGLTYAEEGAVAEAVCMGWCPE